MPLLNVEEETERIRELLMSGFFKRDRSTNSAEDYESSGKAERDMQSSIDYAASEEIQLLWRNEGHLVNADCYFEDIEKLKLFEGMDKVNKAKIFVL